MCTVEQWSEKIKVKRWKKRCWVEMIRVEARGVTGVKEGEEGEWRGRRCEMG